MVKILLDSEVDRWIYIPECPCNNAFFTRFSFDSMNTIVKLITLVIYNDYYESPYELDLVSFGEFISVYSGACETEEYLNATIHEVGCK